MSTARPRVLVIVREYPQISQTYIKNEVETLARDHELCIIAVDPANVADPEHLPYNTFKFREQFLRAISQFKPTLIHCHYLLMVALVGDLAEACGLSFTVRTHSFDVMETGSNHLKPEWRRIRDYIARDN